MPAASGRATSGVQSSAPAHTDGAWVRNVNNRPSRTCVGDVTIVLRLVAPLVVLAPAPRPPVAVALLVVIPADLEAADLEQRADAGRAMLQADQHFFAGSEEDRPGWFRRRVAQREEADAAVALQVVVSAVGQAEPDVVAALLGRPV